MLIVEERKNIKMKRKKMQRDGKKEVFLVWLLGLICGVSLSTSADRIKLTEKIRLWG